MRTAESIEARRPDPLSVTAELPFRGVWYPLGFPLEISTNSADVLAAAEEAWGSNVQEFDRCPLVLGVIVSPEGTLAEPGSHSKQGRLYSIVSDRDNYAHIDLGSGYGFVRVSQATASDHSWLRWFFLEAATYTMLCQRDVVMLHAACVAQDDRGILLCGPSGAGKSTLSYACGRQGWAWLSDDCTCIRPESGGRMALGRSAVARFRLDAPLLFPELESYTVRARPTGKIGIEIRLDEIPNIKVTRRLPIAALVFLERGPGAPSIAALNHGQAVERLLRDLPLYGPEVDPLHENVVRSVAELPAYRLQYQSIADGIELVAKV